MGGQNEQKRLRLEIMISRQNYFPFGTSARSSERATIVNRTPMHSKHRRESDSSSYFSPLLLLCKPGILMFRCASFCMYVQANPIMRSLSSDDDAPRINDDSAAELSIKRIHQQFFRCLENMSRSINGPNASMRNISEYSSVPDTTRH